MIYTHWLSFDLRCESGTYIYNFRNIYINAHTDYTCSSAAACLGSYILHPWNVYILVSYMGVFLSCFVKLTLMEWCQFHIIVQVFKVLHRLCPTYLRDYVETH